MPNINACRCYSMSLYYTNCSSLSSDSFAKVMQIWRPQAITSSTETQRAAFVAGMQASRLEILLNVCRGYGALVSTGQEVTAMLQCSNMTLIASISCCGGLLCRMLSCLSEPWDLLWSISASIIDSIQAMVAFQDASCLETDNYCLYAGEYAGLKCPAAIS